MNVYTYPSLLDVAGEVEVVPQLVLDGDVRAQARSCAGTKRSHIDRLRFLPRRRPVLSPPYVGLYVSGACAELTTPLRLKTLEHFWKAA